MTGDDFRILSMMSTYGGGFVKALATAALQADDENLRRIKETWPEYWAKYTSLAARIEHRDEEGRDVGSLPAAAHNPTADGALAPPFVAAEGPAITKAEGRS